jgi:hypothetical protein
VSRPLYYDRAGNPLGDDGLTVWAKTYEGASLADQRRVAETTLLGGTPWRSIWVSTVWLGLDHGWGDGPPLIFESMIFFQDGPHPWVDEEMDRYSTEAQALVGHVAMSERWIAFLATGSFWNRRQMVGAR